MKHNKFLKISFMVFFIIAIIILFGYKSIDFERTRTKRIYRYGYEDGYKAACSDFYKGNRLRYNLVINPDGTKILTRVNDNNDR